MLLPFRRMIQCWTRGLQWLCGPSLVIPPSSILILPCLSLDPKEAHSVRISSQRSFWPLPGSCPVQDQYSMLCGPCLTFGTHVISTHTSWESLTHRLSHCLHLLCLETRFVGQSVSASYTPGRLPWLCAFLLQSRTERIWDI